MTETTDCVLIEDDLEVPKWLKSDFVEKYLRNYYKNDELKVRTFRVQPASAKGENFSSLIYRVTVDFCKKSTEMDQLNSQSLVIKTTLSSGTALESLLAHNVYDKEIEFYGEIGPQINNQLKKLNDPHKLIADTFGVCRINKVMLFEDLTPKGYGLWSIQRGFSIAEARTVLKKLATFHGICAVLQENQPDIFTNYKHGAMSRDSDAFHSFYYLQLDAMIEVILDWPDFEQYTKKLRHLRKDIVERGCQMFDPNPNHFNTLNHGDFWLNNIMIMSTNDGNSETGSTFENMIFIDFQDSCWASPAIDLHYLLNTSLCETLRPNAFDELVEFYHEHLSTILSRLSYRKHIPTREELLEQFHARDFYGFVTACCSQPFMINESNDDADIEAMVTSDERGMKYRRTMFQQPKVQANLRKLIPIYDQLGLFD